MAEKRNLEIWRRLFEQAGQIEEHQPWEYLTDAELIRVRLQDQTMGYFSILGNAGELFGVNFYPGDEGMTSVRKIVASGEMGMDGLEAVYEQECISLFWGDRDEVSQEQYQVIRDLGLKFRGHGNWIYFERYHKRFRPVFLSEEDAQLMSEGLDLLLEALELYEKKASSGLPLGPVILAYEPEEETEGLVQIPFPEGYPVEEVGVPDETQLFALKKAVKKKRETVLESAVIYGNDLIKGEDDEQYYLRMAVMADHDTGLVIHVQPLQPHESAGQVMTDMLTEWILEQGAPEIIYTEHELARSQVEPLARQLKLRLDVHALPAVDAFAGSMGIERPGMTEGMVAMMNSMLDFLGLDVEELQQKAGSMPEEDFVSDLQKELVAKLKEKSVDDLSEVMPEEDARMLASFGEILALLEDGDGEDASDPDDPDEDWDEEWDEDWDDEWDDDFDEPEVEWFTSEKRQDKETLVHHFFGDLSPEGKKLDEDCDKLFLYDYADREWKKLLKEGKKENLLALAETLGLEADGAMSRRMLAAALLPRLQQEDTFDGSCLSESALSLLGHICSRCSDESEDEWDTEDEELFEVFPYSPDDILELLNYGLIDICYGMSDENEAYLELLVPFELRELVLAADQNG